MLLTKWRIELIFFIVFALTGMGITICKCDTGCPNEAVTPHPISKPSTDCPNMPIASKPIKLPSQSDIAHPTNTNHNNSCVNPIGSPCPLAPICNLPSCCVTESNRPNNNVPVAVDCNLIATCCCQQLCCQMVQPSTTPPPVPETLTKCPPGTQLLGNRCHLLYCPRGSRMINDRCVVIECPEGTIWTGNRCSVSQPTVQNVTFHSTIVTYFNQTTPNIILNNTNNIFVNASVILHHDNKDNNHYSDDDGDRDEADFISETTPTLRCCDVMTPRMCQQLNNHWRCYSRRSRRCGEFCIAPIIYLRPSSIHAAPQYLVMPPIQNNCQSYGNCGPLLGGYDCSGCALNDMQRCSYYCYRYACPSLKCAFYDQQKYCSHETGSYGCQKEDGCLDSWCL